MAWGASSSVTDRPLLSVSVSGYWTAAVAVTVGVDVPLSPSSPQAAVTATRASIRAPKARRTSRSRRSGSVVTLRCAPLTSNRTVTLTGRLRLERTPF